MTTPNLTIRLTTAQALIKYLCAQYSVADGDRRRLVPATLGIFGHGNVAGLGQALDELADEMPFIQGRHEQYLAHISTAYAKASRRRAVLAVTASIGPGALNLVTAAGLATVNRIPLLLLPGDTYATRHQGPVLQQLEHPTEADATVNDAFRPVSRFFDRITRPEQLLTALPQAMRVLTSPTDAGAVVISLPQDVQSHAYDFPARFFEPRDWKIRRPLPDPEEVEDVVRLIRGADRPVIVAGGGIHYSDAHAALEALAAQTGIPVVETFGGKGAVTRNEWWQLGGVGLEGNFASNNLVKQADLVLSVGTRLTDFATGSQSLFEDPNVRFASLNIVDADTRKQGATGILADARLGLEALAVALKGQTTSKWWQDTVQSEKAHWAPIRSKWLDADTPYDAADHPDAPVTGALLTQPQLIGLMQEHARPGDTVIAAAGGPPGDLQKVWDATDNRHCHLEFGFSCMGYEIAAGMGVRLAQGNNDNRVVTFIGDGTFLMAPTEILTAAQEGLNVTIVVSENHGYQVIHRLQMNRSGKEFGNEFRYRTAAGSLATQGTPTTRLDGDYLRVDLRQIAEGLGALAIRATSAADVRQALESTRNTGGPVVIVVPTVPHVDLPGGDVWWDVAPAEVSRQEAVRGLRKEYELARGAQRWFG
ncbi:3D-(3,5/4)-trihydroxycyclohexane-1,2-dione acylhydrolase (decyclizing) [Arthrobacter silviterrae]|uniref:3D-(3,5/4)-trihydroxycyclohexane-1,2-dione acylhydrolase (Decyclizing) n=1 Tax=Arthrobacter silviterrae TaxID=2026658 RepID=A0ABX0DFZ1_9MICC|nr:3D-(3,5/4)-trihydroxycyclohexane-1,2-dione acylhydrolase (decyclizing) [Arthrobacter silviterrae]MDQ0276505.1 3D-(3,5/4)-trihydroxycyclohexane-1,2-dione acylhydrolase (decyclizing) [Arthrobacter silviterrae]NGN85538.1 3D-(3,5/4)-trihydroxycyclohexane-1,2-dione acylhydrolase (decyclizing) [Arthrobacter silviterrae]